MKDDREFFRHRAARWTLRMLLALIGSAASPTAGQVFDDRGFNRNRDSFSQLPFEHIDPLTGNLLLMHTDLALPGNAGFDLRIQRVYNSKIHINYALGQTGFAEDSWAGVGWTLHMGRIFNVLGTDTASPVVEMPDGSRHPTFNIVGPGSEYISRDYWLYDKNTRILKLPNGLVYTFGRTTTVGSSSVAYATEIRDPFGNTITINYLGTPVDAISSIVQNLAASEQRTITFDTVAGELRAMHYGTSTWNYTHEATGQVGFSYLRVVDPPEGMNRDAIPRPAGAPEEFFHFPDGNATIARRLVQSLVPDVFGGATVEDVVTGQFDYGRLDQASAPARIRLDSTVVRVRHQGPEATRTVEVTYMKDGKLHAVRGDRCVLACWNSMIPHLCPELPAEQKAALTDSTKVPLLYTSVLVRDWTPFTRLKVRSIYAPGSYHSRVSLSPPVTVGAYRAPRRPEEPMALHMVRTPCQPGLPARQQHRAGRLQLLTTTFADFELKIRDQLGRTLGPGGFEPARDIQAITVNRWPHGYAYQYNSLWDEFWRDGTEPPCVRARRPFGRISIANADADAYSYTDAAIDQAWRAVGELLA